MQRLTALLVLVVLVASSPFTSAQEKVDRDALNAKALTALTSKKFDEAIDCFTRILGAFPDDNGTAYNMACAYSLKGDVEKGIEWLTKAVDMGWGSGVGNLVGSQKPLSHADMSRTDPDLENIRKDPRFAPLVERMEKYAEAKKALQKKADEYAATAATYIPEKLAGAKEMPVLVVLHDAESTKDLVVKGRWKAVADELGFALIAPSGKIPAGDDPAKGMNWFESLELYKARPFLYEKLVNDAVSAFQKEHPLDKTKVVVAGEGVGGLVALNVGINGPGLFKGVVSLNGGFRPELYAGKAPNAGKMGLRVALLHDTAKLGKDGEAQIAAQNKSLQTWGLAGEAKAFTPDPKDAGEQRLLVEAVRAVLTPSAAVPAGAPSITPK